MGFVLSGQRGRGNSMNPNDASHTETPVPVHGVKQVASRWAQHRFLLMIIASISVALLLVVISTTIYYMNGTAQLDLSRPSYQPVRDELKKNKTTDSQTAFSSTGDISEEMFKDFIKRYEVRSKDATSLDAFSGEPMSDQALGITSAPTQ